MTKEKCRELFYYKDGKLYWRKFIGGVTRAHREVGSISMYGYRRCKCLKKYYQVHRLVWIYHYGEIAEGHQIDHINHIPDDNRIENLRVVTCLENHRNKSRSLTNTSGVVGVDWKKERNKWRASIHTDGKRKFLGYFDDFDRAVSVRRLAEKTYGYHPNHGT